MYKVEFLLINRGKKVTCTQVKFTEVIKNVLLGNTSVV